MTVSIPCYLGSVINYLLLKYLFKLQFNACPFSRNAFKMFRFGERERWDSGYGLASPEAGRFGSLAFRMVPLALPAVIPDRRARG